jgi:hypothetical protein
VDESQEQAVNLDMADNMQGPVDQKNDAVVGAWRQGDNPSIHCRGATSSLTRLACLPLAPTQPP